IDTCREQLLPELPLQFIKIFPVEIIEPRSLMPCHGFIVYINERFDVLKSPIQLTVNLFIPEQFPDLPPGGTAEFTLEYIFRTAEIRPHRVPDITDVIQLPERLLVLEQRVESHEFRHDIVIQRKSREAFLEFQEQLTEI